MRDVQSWLREAEVRREAERPTVRRTRHGMVSHRTLPTCLLAMLASTGSYACQPLDLSVSHDAGTNMATAHLDSPAPGSTTVLAHDPEASSLSESSNAGSHDGGYSDGDTLPTNSSAGDEPTNEPSVDAGDGRVANAAPDAASATTLDAKEGSPECLLVEAAECNPVAQCGCAADLNCDYSPNSPHLFSCVAPGEIPAQAACDDTGECQLGYVCASGLCASTCRNIDDCSVNERCVQLLDETGNSVEGVRVCERECDPLEPEACGAGATCVLHSSPSTPICVRQTGAASEGEPCSAHAECERGLGCAADGVCRSWCDLAQPGDADADAGDSAPASGTREPVSCAADATCEPFSPVNGLGLCGAECRKAPTEGSTCGRIPTTCGCDEGETCQALEGGRTECGVPGPNGYMTWCNKNYHCGPELSCLGGLCRPSCEQGILECGDQGLCAAVLASEEEQTFACMGLCDPVSPERASLHYTPCGTGAYCSPGVAATRINKSHCVRGDDSPEERGGTCTSDFDCENGLACYVDGTDQSSDNEGGTARGICLPWCRSDSDCASNEHCSKEAPTTARVGREAEDTIGICLADY